MLSTDTSALTFWSQRQPSTPGPRSNV